jgi:uncharacterized protein YjiS (DUF1127 family)
MSTNTLSNIYVRPRNRTGFFGRLSNAFEIHRQRRYLAEMSDRLLEDIGVSREQANKEAKRPFWDAM